MSCWRETFPKGKLRHSRQLLASGSPWRGLALWWHGRARGPGKSPAGGMEGRQSPGAGLSPGWLRRAWLHRAAVDETGNFPLAFGSSPS